MSQIDQVLTPTTHDLGQFQVRRVLPAKARSMVGPFIFVDQFGPAQLDLGGGMDVRPHPHINLATVTWLFEGAIDHRDSTGTFSTIRPGTVNLMTAGSGIVHSERSPPSERKGGPRMFGMQTWLALPDGREEIVLHVPKYDFNWQTLYQFEQPLSAPKGARLEASAWYDNSAANKANPDPTADVRWGQQTWEEMQYTGVTYRVVNEP